LAQDCFRAIPKIVSVYFPFINKHPFLRVLASQLSARLFSCVLVKVKQKRYRVRKVHIMNSINIQTIKSTKSSLMEIARGNWVAVVVLTLIVMAILVDNTLQEVRAPGASSEDAHYYYVAEMITVILCIILPALYFHFGGSQARRANPATTNMQLAWAIDDSDEEPRWLSECSEEVCPPSVRQCAKPPPRLEVEPSSPCKVVEKKFPSKIESNVVSHSSMIDACAKAGDPQGAELWHKRMLEDGVEPNAHSFSSLVSACAKAGDVTAACQWLGQMEVASVPADIVVYSSILDACAKVGDGELAKQLFEKMRSQGITPDAVSYASLARPFATRGDWQEVERISGQMRSEGLAMNEYFLYALLLSYGSARPRQANRAEIAFHEAHAAGVELNKHVLTAFARAVGRLRCSELLAELKVNGQQADVRPCSPTFPSARRS